MSFYHLLIQIDYHGWEIQFPEPNKANIMQLSYIMLFTYSYTSEQVEQLNWLKGSFLIWLLDINIIT